MGVNWSKDIDQTLTTAKEQSRPILLDFSAAPVEEPVLGWMPSRMKIRKLPSSSAKTFFRSKLTLRNTRCGSTALTRSGRRLCSSSIARARSVCDWKAICRTAISSPLSSAVSVASPSCRRSTPMRSGGTAMWSLALAIPILHRRRCTGGQCRATRPRTITRYWAKSPRNFEALTRPVCGRASPFRGCINTTKSTCKNRFAATPRLTG